MTTIQKIVNILQGIDYHVLRRKFLTEIKLKRKKTGREQISIAIVGWIQLLRELFLKLIVL